MNDLTAVKENFLTSLKLIKFTLLLWYFLPKNVFSITDESGNDDFLSYFPEFISPFQILFTFWLLNYCLCIYLDSVKLLNVLKELFYWIRYQCMATSVLLTQRPRFYYFSFWNSALHMKSFLILLLNSFLPSLHSQLLSHDSLLLCVVGSWSTSKVLYDLLPTLNS